MRNEVGGNPFRYDTERPDTVQECVQNEGGLMAEQGVEVVWSALSRAWRKAEYEELWLQFRPRGSKDVLDAFGAGVEVANQVVEDVGWGDDAFTEGVSDSDAGPVALMSRTGPEPAVRAWFAAFA